MENHKLIKKNAKVKIDLARFWKGSRPFMVSSFSLCIFVTSNNITTHSNILLGTHILF